MIRLVADERSDFYQLIKRNSGFYYCEETNRVVFLTVTHGQFLDRQVVTIDFAKNAIEKTSSDQINMFYDELTYLRIKSKIDVVNDDIAYFIDDGNKYVSMKLFDSKQLISNIKERTMKKFENAIGKYYDSVAKRALTIESDGESFALFINNNDGKSESDILKIVNNYEAIGKDYVLYLENGTLKLYFRTDCESESYEYVIKKAEPKYDAKRENSNEKVYRNTYTFGDNWQKLEILPDEIYITHGSTWNKDYKIDAYEPKYTVFIDEYGYKHVEFGIEKFIIIDGKTQNFAFYYHGESLKNDSEAIQRIFRIYPDSWIKTDYLAGYRNINGGYFSNIKASSTLSDQYHNYNAGNTLRVFNPFEKERYWAKNNIPWVEGSNTDGVGESIELDIKPIDWSAVVGIDFRILNGYVDPLKPYLFRENNRIRRANIETDSGINTEVLFEDAIEFTNVKLPKNTKHVKITITEVYRGTKYNDTCITAFDMYYDLWDK